MKVPVRQGPPVAIRSATATCHPLSGPACIAAVAVVFHLLVGCGFSLNSTSGLATGQGAGTPGEPGGQSVPAPGAVQALTGCANPNTGTSNGDWGVGLDPVYTVVDNDAPVVGAPIYTSNAVFWTSRETAPGQSILLAGAFTDATKTAMVAFIPSGTTDWQALVRGSTVVVSTIQQSTTGLSFIVPVSFPAGIYGYEIEDPSAPAVLGLANVPSLNWAIGVPSVTGPGTALQHQVYDCGVEPGGILRLFGKNFVASNQVILQSSSGVAYSLSPSKLDSNSATVTVPGSLAPGTYSVWVGSSPWSVTSSPAAQVTVYSPPSLMVQKVACSNLVGDGVRDNTKRLQSCLDWYAPIEGAMRGSMGVVVYISIPAGNFVLTGGVTAHPFEVLVGSSSTTTNFLGRPQAHRRRRGSTYLNTSEWPTYRYRHQPTLISFSAQEPRQEIHSHPAICSSTMSALRPVLTPLAAGNRCLPSRALIFRSTTPSSSQAPIRISIFFMETAASFPATTLFSIIGPGSASRTAKT